MFLADRQWLWLAAGCYAAGLALGTLALARERKYSKFAMYVIVALGYIFQTLGLVARGKAVQGCPLGNTFEIFQFTAWSATGVYLIIGARFQLSMLGYFTACLSAALTALSLALPSWDAVRWTSLHAGNPWVALHAGLAIFSYGIFAVLALTALLAFLRDYSLRSKRLGGWFSFLPPLSELEQISVRLLVGGVCAMTAALVMGYFYWKSDVASVGALKIVAVVLVWLAYAGALLLRTRGALVGRRFFMACSALFIVAMVSLWPVDQSRHPPITAAPQRATAP